MAELILSSVGQALGSQLPGALSQFGAALGRAGGAYLGRALDQQIFGGVREYEGARLTDLHLQGSTEGASLPLVFGRARLAGQVIWAARFKERAETRDVGGKGGPRATSTNYRYSLSFAVGLCEGEVARIGRVWANGQPLDLAEFAWRLHKGSEDQAPDPLIEVIEGAENAPAYRGLAYIVFEDMPLERFGNSIPQLSFEIVRPPPAASDALRFEDRVKSVCLIPGAGEFVYATVPVLREEGPGRQSAQNVHAEHGRANLLVALDQLEADFPNCETVALVVAWFGNDLRCGECEIRPGVEVAEKETTPMAWRAGGVDRGGAHVVSLHDGAPAYGGTPADASVLQAIAELKTRGYRVALYPFLLMDVPAENGLPVPYGGDEQAAYPWRGRISLHPAPGEAGTPDKAAAATSQVNAFFGAATPSHFGVSGGLPTYSGPSEWSYRRFVLHYAKLAAVAGGADAFVIGSELRGLTRARDGAASFPTVDALVALAADARAMLGPDTKLTYAADWSEYANYRPDDGSGDLFFHLDPLWAKADIDAVGVDWYPPLSDWRDGATHLDAALARRPHDLDYLQGRIEAGEAYDWAYASEPDRQTQTRAAISDGAYDEPWVFRAKDLRSFWANAHHNRPGGVRDDEPTAWVPQSKPIWLVELGCPAVDKGANAPNVFVDPKSAESALPHFSNGTRDDLIQRRALEAYLSYWEIGAGNNPLSALTGAPMIEEISLWAWDARPHPAFPARSDVWTDGGAWRLGHWLNGRAGLSVLSEVTDALCLRAGVSDADVSALVGAVSGYVVDSPLSMREALEPLMAAYDFIAAEREGALVFMHRAETEAVEISPDVFATADIDLFAQRADAFEAPIEARVRFLDAARDYLIAGVSARRRDAAEGGVDTLAAPLVLEAETAEALAQRVLADSRAAMETLRIALGPAHLALEPGDRVRLAGSADSFEIARVEEAETRRLELRRQRIASSAELSVGEPNPPVVTPLAPTPAFAVLDLPPLPGVESDERPLAAVFAAPWLGPHVVHAGAAPTPRAIAAEPAAMGELLWALWPGPVDRWDQGNIVRVKMYGASLSSVSRADVLAGANVFAIEADGEWEIVQARVCTLVGDGEYELSDLLRARLGSAHAMQSPHPVGARIVKLDAKLTRLDIGAHEWAEPLDIIAPPAGAGVDDVRAARATFTLPHAALRPWAPAHLRAKRDASGDVAISWVRCARIGGEAWGAGEPPLGAAAESYRLDILDGGDVVRTVLVGDPAFTYDAASQTVDFGVLPGSLHFRVAQIGDSGATGLNSELTITL